MWHSSHYRITRMELRSTLVIEEVLDVAKTRIAVV
jgi:hypothetical protein